MVNSVSMTAAGAAGSATTAGSAGASTGVLVQATATPSTATRAAALTCHAERMERFMGCLLE